MTAKFLEVAEQYVGIKELYGKATNKVIKEWFNELGYPELDDSTAWCSLFANVVVREAGYASAGSLAARSWLKWGKPLSKPVPGCIVVLKRGNSEWEGHVGFFVSETDTKIKILGGNQNNEVNISSFPKSQLLGYRQPATMALSKTAVSAAGSGVSTVGAQIIDATTNLQTTVAGIPVAYAKYALVVIGIALIFMTLYFKWNDIVKKG